MVAVGYEVDRAILLTLYLLLIALSLTQINAWYKRWKKKKHSDAKNFIHTSIFLASFFLFLGVIDLGGVFKLYNRYACLVLVGVGWNFLFVASFFLIYSHLQAHYLALRKKMSMLSFWILGIFLLIGFFTYVLGQTLSEKYQQERFQTYAMFYICLEIIIIKIYSAIGYWKIRTLLVEAVRLENPDYQVPSLCCPQEQTTKRRETESGICGVDYENLLQKMWKFHAFVFVLGFGFLGFFIWWFTSAFDRLYTPPIYLDPQSFGFDITAHSFLPGLFIYTWWAWVPLTKEEGESSHYYSGTDGKENRINTIHSSQKKTQMSSMPDVVEIRDGTGSPEQEMFIISNNERDISSSIATPSSPSKGAEISGFKFPETDGSGGGSSGLHVLSGSGRSGVHPVIEEERSYNGSPGYNNKEERDDEVEMDVL